MAWNAFVSATMSMFEWGHLSRYSVGYIVMDIAERVRALLDGQPLVCFYIRLYVCMYVCMYVCIFVYVCMLIVSFRLACM